MWNDEKFRKLSPIPPCGQGLWLYLLTCTENRNVPGIFEAREVGLADKLGWPLEAFREAFREALALGLAKANWEAGLLWLPKAIFHNRPESINVVKSWGNTWDDLPECELKNEAFQYLLGYLEGLGLAYAEAFAKACGKAWPIQEQEQEPKQKPKQEQEPTRARTREEDFPKSESPPSKLPSWRDEPFIWQRVIACWIEKTGFPIDAQANQRDAEPITAKCLEVNRDDPYAVLEKVFDGWLADDWVRKNRPPLSNLRKNFQKYAVDPPESKPEPSRAAVYQRDAEETERRAHEAMLRYEREQRDSDGSEMSSAKDILEKIKEKARLNS